MDKGNKKQRVLQQINESFLQKNDKEMYATHNEGKSVIAERFIRT